MPCESRETLSGFLFVYNPLFVPWRLKRFSLRPQNKVVPLQSYLDSKYIYVDKEYSFNIRHRAYW